MIKDKLLPSLPLCKGHKTGVGECLYMYVCVCERERKKVFVWFATVAIVELQENTPLACFCCVFMVTAGFTSYLLPNRAFGHVMGLG